MDCISDSRLRTSPSACLGNEYFAMVIIILHEMKDWLPVETFCMKIDKLLYDGSHYEIVL